MILGLGSNYFGQLAIPSTSSSSRCAYSPVELSVGGRSVLSTEIKGISCGTQFTAFMKKDGTLLFCGTMNGSITPLISPIIISYPLKCMQLSSGKKHILALMEGGFVLSWGLGYFGQLGHGDDSSWDQPRLIHQLNPAELGTSAVSVACGAYHSIAVTKDGRAFSWGLNKSGQCGLGSKEESIALPKPVDFKTSVKCFSVACGRNHSVALAEGGVVWAWGASSFGRLGIVDAPKCASSPMIVPTFRSNPCAHISCGDFHTLALTRDSAVWSWGRGGDGQLGHGNIYNMRTPQIIEHLRGIDIIQVFGGPFWSFALSGDGLLFAWGNSDGGWLGMAPKKCLPMLDCDSEDLPLTCTDVEVQSFDSNMNLLVPTQSRIFASFVVSDVHCGGGHTLVRCRRRPQDDRTTAAEEQMPELFSWIRHGKLGNIRLFFLQHGNSNQPEIVDFKDVDGNTMLIVAAQNGKIDIVRLLVQNGANVNCTNFKGNTALHYSFAMQYHDIGRFLISVGGDEYLLNEEGLTCYEGLTVEDLDNF